MNGTYTPSDVVTNFINTESFEIPKDGKYTYLGQGYNPKSRRSLVVKDNQIIIEENNINSDRNE